jgi:hypothetical protein
MMAVVIVTIMFLIHTILSVRSIIVIVMILRMQQIDGVIINEHVSVCTVPNTNQTEVHKASVDKPPKDAPTSSRSGRRTGHIPGSDPNSQAKVLNYFLNLMFPQLHKTHFPRNFRFRNRLIQTWSNVERRPVYFFSGLPVAPFLVTTLFFIASKSS